MRVIEDCLTENNLMFLGTAGTRFNVINQTRASGGMIVSLNGVNVAIDPGPGALVAMCSRRPFVDPNRIQAILLTHRHIDHSGDVNVVAEAMTGGGRRPGGIIALPSDALEDEPVIYRYLRNKIGLIHTWREGELLRLAGIEVAPLKLKHHGVECYGFRFHDPSDPDWDWGIVSDTTLTSEIAPFFRGCRTMVVNATLLEKVERIEHLSIPDVSNLIESIAPERLFMTHLGTRILENSPERIALSLSRNGTTVTAAYDGMVINLRGVK